MSELPKSTEDAVQYMLPRDLLHDLRTPLGHILGYSELLIEQMQQSGNNEFVPHLEKIRAAGRKLLELMKDNFQELRPPDALPGESSGTGKSTGDSQA
jgi:signal transduction histidine kinase